MISLLYTKSKEFKGLLNYFMKPNSIKDQKVIYESLPYSGKSIACGTEEYTHLER